MICLPWPLQHITFHIVAINTLKTKGCTIYYNKMRHPYVWENKMDIAILYKFSANSIQIQVNWRANKMWLLNPPSTHRSKMATDQTSICSDLADIDDQWWRTCDYDEWWMIVIAWYDTTVPINWKRQGLYHASREKMSMASEFPRSLRAKIANTRRRKCWCSLESHFKCSRVDNAKSSIPYTTKNQFITTKN